jgi:hypothetical protein
LLGICTSKRDENGKMRPVETIPGMGGGEIKENHGEGEFK